MEEEISQIKSKKISIETLGIVVGFSSVLAAIAWFFGSMYYAGYFMALGIKGNFITYSNEFLIGRGILSLFSPLLSIFYLYTLLFVERFLSQESANKLVQFTKKRLKISNSARHWIIYFFISFLMIGFFYFLFIKIKNTDIPLENFVIIGIAGVVIGLYFFDIIYYSFRELMEDSEIKKHIAQVGDFNNIFRIVIISSLVFFLFLAPLITEVKRGYKSGCEVVNVNPSSITIYTKAPIIRNSSFISSNTNLYEYSAFLVQVGDEFLIVFEDTDKTSLLPNEIYYIAKNQITSFVVKPPAEISSDKELVDKCVERSRSILQFSQK